MDTLMVAPVPRPDEDDAELSLEEWLQQERRIARDRLLRNVSPPDGRPGVILAAPSRANPDYYFHWIRDAGIAARSLLLLYQQARESAAKQRYFQLLMDYVDFTRTIQRTAVRRGVGLGEPKFTVNGLPYVGPWARPQDDGPAIRAIGLVHLAFMLLEEGRLGLVREKLYDARNPGRSVIKADLAYIARSWRNTCFDLWEEERGHHFFTRLLEQKALAAGVALATRLGDVAAAGAYLEQAEALGEELGKHWDPERRYLVSVRDQEGAPNPPRSGLDSSVIVATLGGCAVDLEPHVACAYPADHEQVLATVVAIEDAFKPLYPINDPSRGIPGIAVGRYPEDRYDGYRADTLGNPWPCLTLALAMYYYRLAERYQASGRIAVTTTSLPFFQRLPIMGEGPSPGQEITSDDPQFDGIIAALGRGGDAYLARVRYHANPDGSLAEQMNRATGAQQGAPDLSMNYAALLATAELRRRLSAPD
jgi:glucoamylase